MPDRTYAQFCALARALDVTGERWSLLVVRELLAGPKRYTDLHAGLPGISTDMLAARLRELDKAGVVKRQTLPPPAAATVYELTAVGRELEPVVMALARWGLHLLDARRRGDEFRIEWLGLTLRTMLQPEHAAGPPLTLDFHVAGQRLQVRIAEGELHTQVGPTEQADVTIAADPAIMAELARDPELAARAAVDGRLRVTGSAEAIGRMTRALGMARPARRKA